MGKINRLNEQQPCAISPNFLRLHFYTFSVKISNTCFSCLKASKLSHEPFWSSIFPCVLSQPELTVENLPSFLSLGKALLLLFVGEEEDGGQNQNLLEEMRGVVELGDRRLERYLPSWIHLYVHQSQMMFNQYHTGFLPVHQSRTHTSLFYCYSKVCLLSFSGRTPGARSVLGSYFGSMPSLPTLVLTCLPSGDEVYRYPPDTPIVAASILGWLQRVEDRSEPPAGRKTTENDAVAELAGLNVGF